MSSPQMLEFAIKMLRAGKEAQGMKEAKELQEILMKSSMRDIISNS
jgi:hypothetical protein